MISATDRSRRTVIRGARLFDGSAVWDRPDSMVVIDGARIVAVDAGTAPPPDAELVDLPGATLLPGLIDPHVHLAFDASADPVGALAARSARSAQEVAEAMVTAGRTALAGGVTTVRDLGDLGYLSLGLRGRAGLPEIVAAGPPITTPYGHCHYLGGGVDDDEQAVRAAVRERAERGCDVVKVMASGGTLTPGTRQELAQFQPQVLAAIVDQAHRLGLPVAVHAHATAAIVAALAAGTDSIEHVTFWSAEGVDAPQDVLHRLARSGTVIGLTAGMLPAPPGLAAPPAVVARLGRVFANIRHLHELGATIALGTDAGIGLVKPHDILRTTIWQAAQVGIEPLEALQLATVVNAGVVGLADRKGRLAPGFDADVLAVDGDPLVSPDVMDRIVAVYARGQLVTAA